MNPKTVSSYTKGKTLLFSCCSARAEVPLALEPQMLRSWFGSKLTYKNHL